MTFTCPYFWAKVMVKFARRAKGQRTLCGAYLNWHASNHMHFWTRVVFIHQAITKIMLHPESSALIITAALDGLVKVNSLDLMEEIYRLT